MILTRTAAWFSRKAPATIVGVVGFGVLGSFLYDLLVKPGVSSASQGVFSLITFGSSTLRNAIYSSAALDPRPVTSLLVIFAIATIPIGFFLGRAIPGRSKAKKELDRIREALDKAAPEEVNGLADQARALQRWLNRRLIGYYAIGLSLSLVWLIFLMMHSHSVLVWRVSHADMTLLRPYVGETGYNDLRAQFAGMQDYSDFQAFRADIERHALESGVQLRPEEI